MKNIANTEYAVEVNKEDKFVRQLDVFDTYEKAVCFMENCNEPLSDGEYLNIIFIDYNENGDEIGFCSVV